MIGDEWAVEVDILVRPQDSIFLVLPQWPIQLLLIVVTFGFFGLT